LKDYFRPRISPELSLPTDSSNPEENIALFLIGFGLVIILWILICCIWVIRRHYDDGKNQSYPTDDLIHFNKNNLCLRVNPFETNHISTKLV
jgi:hypothetical protein